ncbi:anti-sigma factor RsbA family regulatory protein [Actinokineospora iranica]|uniref:anti-sigma factor RsbA family regulatory protein n=1 Tax=Actinokineospora iranica TaxID=1271860 RepID=UPI000B8A5FBF
MSTDDEPQGATPARVDTAVDQFIHPALFYAGAQDYLAGTVPFIREGLANGHPVAVAVPGPNLALLRDELGRDGDAVQWLDMTEAGRNPGRIIPGVLRAFADARLDGRVRIIGEPIWAGRTSVEYPACVQHEALINLAFTGREVTILCPYDLDHLDPTVLADAEATHPTLIDRDGDRESPGYAPGRILSTYNLPLPPAPTAAATLPFDRSLLVTCRRFAVDHAQRAGIPTPRLGDLELAVAELVANSIMHGGGQGTLTLWVEADTLVFQVHDSGRLTNPLAGRIPAPATQPGGRGLLLVNYLVDLVRQHTDATGTTIRGHLNIPR